MSNILLRLDSSALNALFPEGSEARIDLQQAVISEFVKKHIKPGALGPGVLRELETVRADVLSEINRAKEEMAQKVLKDQGVIRDVFGRIELKNEAKATINEATRKVMQNEIAIAAEKLRDEISGAVEAAVNRMTENEVRMALKTHVEAVIGQISKLAVAP